MKFLVFACVIVLASSAGIKNQIKNLISNKEAVEGVEICLSENNMTMGDWIPESDIMINVHAESETAEKRRKNGCAVACILKKFDFMDGSNINESKVHEEISQQFAHSPAEETVHKVARKCMKEARNIVEECDKGYSLYVCVGRAAHELQEHEDHEREVTESNREQKENDKTNNEHTVQE